MTNTTKESKRVLLERLHKIGFSIKEEQVFTSLTAARILIDRRRLSPLLLVDDKALEEFQGMQKCRWYGKALDIPYNSKYSRPSVAQTQMARLFTTAVANSFLCPLEKIP